MKKVGENCGEQPSEKKEKRGKMFGFRADPDVEQMIVDAKASTGSSVTELLQECVRRHIVDVVNSIQAERQSAGARLKKSVKLPTRLAN